MLEYSARVADKKLKGIHFDEGGKRFAYWAVQKIRGSPCRPNTTCLRVEVDVSPEVAVPDLIICYNSQDPKLSEEPGRPSIHP